MALDFLRDNGGYMNEKKIIRCFCFAMLLALCFAGCKTTGSYSDESVLEHQRRIIELEDANRALTERIGQYDSLIARTVQRLEAVRERADGIRDSADRIEYLFAEYERTVQQLIYELRPGDGEIGKRTESYKDVIGYLVMLDGFEGFADYCRMYMAGYQ
jgi:hypothetical protein